VVLTLLREPALTLVEEPQDAAGGVRDSARGVEDVVEQVPSQSVGAPTPLVQPRTRWVVGLLSPQLRGLPEGQETVSGEVSPVEPGRVASGWLVGVV